MLDQSHSRVVEIGRFGTCLISLREGSKGIYWLEIHLANLEKLVPELGSMQNMSSKKQSIRYPIYNARVLRFRPCVPKCLSDIIFIKSKELTSSILDLWTHTEGRLMDIWQ
jgi:hypothetical protein